MDIAVPGGGRLLGKLKIEKMLLRDEIMEIERNETNFP